MNTTMTNNPLISIGLPTYNRPSGLRKTLDCLTQQTYNNIEIIISDNASSSPETSQVVKEFMEKDERIKFFQQPENKGVIFNFKFVLEKAIGKYFMWAADDDLWANDFVEKLVTFFKNSDTKYIGAITEAQYIQGEAIKYDFFREGEAFYDFYSESKMKRLEHMLQSNYGNLVYGLFEAAILKRDLIFTMNEIPLLLQIIEKGNIKVLPEIGFYKTAPSYNAYLQAKWEKNGGTLPNSSFTYKYYKNLNTAFIYHKAALANIKKTISILELKYWQKSYLFLLSFYYIACHFFYLIIMYKPKIGDRNTI